jgi:Glycosyl hydrolases family 39
MTRLIATGIAVDARSTGAAVAPAWKKCVGGGRAAGGLRADFQRHLELAQRQIGFEYIRCRGPLCDDMMVHREAGEKPVHNWQYLDVEALRRRTQLAATVQRQGVPDGVLRGEVVVEPHGVVLVEVSPWAGRAP